MLRFGVSQQNQAAVGKPPTTERYDQLALDFFKHGQLADNLSGGGFSPGVYQQLVLETVSGKPVFFRKPALAYSLIGLAGEVGETRELIFKIDNQQLDQADRLAIGDELGDICWYFTQVSLALGTNLDSIFRAAAQQAGYDLASSADFSLADFQDMIAQSQALESGSKLQNSYLAFNNKIDSLFNKIKKLNRDYEFKLNRAQADDLQANLVEIVLKLTQVAIVADINLEDHVTKANIIKLAGRYGLESQLIDSYLADQIEAYRQLHQTG